MREFNNFSVAQEQLYSRKKEVSLLQNYPVDLILTNPGAPAIQELTSGLASGIGGDVPWLVQQW